MTATTGAVAAGHRRGAAPWFILEGVLLLILGLAAAVLPGLAGIAGALVFGWILIVSGLFGLATLMGSRAHTHVAFGVISSLIAIVVGALVIWRPLLGAISLAILLAVYLLIDGMAMIGMGLDQRRRPAKGWPWLVVAGVIDILLGLFILALGPLPETVVVGYVIAIDLAVAGIALITLGLHARSA
jgi:membrane protein HdeD